MKATDPDHQLFLGNVDLLGHDHSEGWWIEATADGLDFGNPVPLTRAVMSFLLDGAIEETEAHDNREMTFNLRVTGTSADNLALAEAALFAEVGKGNSLTWQPPDIGVAGVGEMSLFQVVNSSLAYSFGDILELNLIRVYTLTIKALPFAYGATGGNVTSGPPPTSTPVATLIDDANSTSGWSAGASTGSFSGATLTQSGGQVHAVAGFPKGTALRRVSLLRSGLSINMSATPYVRVKLTATAGGTFDHVAGLLNGTSTAYVARDGDYYWFPFSGTLNTVDVWAYAKFPSANGSIFLNIDNIYRTDTTSLATIAGQRQQYMTAEVVGTARAQGTIIVNSVGGVGLGSTLIYTDSSQSGVQPDLRRRMLAGPTESSDSSLVSGKSSTLTTTHYFALPVELPQSGYVLYARLKHTSTGTYSIGWGAQVVPTSDPTTIVTGTLGQTGNQSVALTAGVWTIAPIAKLVLPTSTSGVEIQQRVSLSSASAVQLDEAWLFDADNGRLTWVECGTGTGAPAGPFNRLDAIAASLSNPVPSVMMSGGLDPATQVNAGYVAGSIGAHEFVPPMLNVFVVTTGSVTTEIIGDYLPAYHTHVLPPA